MSANQDKKSILKDVVAKKKELLVARIKRSSGDIAALKNAKNIRKDIARLFTKFNAK